MATNEIRIVDSILASRVDRIRRGRGNPEGPRTARQLLEERLLELETHGDPVALTPSSTAPAPPPAAPAQV